MICYGIQESTCHYIWRDTSCISHISKWEAKNFTNECTIYGLVTVIHFNLNFWLIISIFFFFMTVVSEPACSPLHEQRYQVALSTKARPNGKNHLVTCHLSWISMHVSSTIYVAGAVNCTGLQRTQELPYVYNTKLSIMCCITSTASEFML